MTGNTRRQAELRDQAIQTWDEIYEGPDPDEMFFRLLVPLVAPGIRLVDIGCGTGHILGKLLVLAPARPSRVTGIDPSVPMLDIARKRISDAAGVEWLQGEAAHLPLEGGSVDLALSRLSEYVPAELARVLVPGGHFVEYGLGPLDSAEIAQAFGGRYVCDYVPGDTEGWLASRDEALRRVGLVTVHFEVVAGVDYLTRRQLVETIEMVPLVEPLYPIADAAVIDGMPVERRPVWGEPRYVVHRQVTVRVARKLP